MRLGIIGCGYVTLDRHLPALRHVPEVEVVAFADTRPETAAEVARLLGAGRVVDTEHMLEDGEVEAVAVCTPPATHAELAIAALEAGKHVLLEKPVAASLEEADRIAERAARSPQQVLVGFNFRRHRFVERARRLVAEGALGTVQAVRTAFTNPVLDEQQDWKRRRGLGGGGLLDRAGTGAARRLGRALGDRVRDRGDLDLRHVPERRQVPVERDVAAADDPETHAAF